MSENLDSLKENWYDGTITGMVAKKFKEIISKKWENIFLLKDLKTNKYLNKFEYDGRELSTRTVYQNSEVWDFDIWEWTNCVSLGDITMYPEFYQAIQEVEKDEWINFHITESIWLNDCLIVAWKREINFKDIAQNVGLRDWDAIDKVLLQICDNIKSYLEPEFLVKINYSEHKLFLQAHGQSKQIIIDKSPIFIDKIQRISQYFDEHLDEIEQSFKSLSEQEQKKNEIIKESQNNKLKDLQSQL